MAFDIKSEGGPGFSTNGNGYSFPAVTLSNATGDEVAFQIDYTTNKATSGNDSGFIINQTDTLSPGTSYLQQWKVAGVAKVFFTNAGLIRTSGVVQADTAVQAATFLTLGVADMTFGNGITANNDGLVSVKAIAGITADVGSSQGDGPLTVGVNEISVCANAGDAVTLPVAVVNLSHEVTILNNGANACDVFPASGDNLGAGVDTASSLAAGANITYKSYDATNWFVKT